MPNQVGFVVLGYGRTTNIYSSPQAKIALVHCILLPPNGASAKVEKRLYISQVKGMKNMKRKFTSAFKAQVAIEALKERETLAELALRFEVHATMISKWKQEFLSNSAQLFDKAERAPETGVDTDKLYAKIGQLEMENDFLKKNLNKIVR